MAQCSKTPPPILLRPAGEQADTSWPNRATPWRTGLGFTGSDSSDEVFQGALDQESSHEHDPKSICQPHSCCSAALRDDRVLGATPEPARCLDRWPRRRESGRGGTGLAHSARDHALTRLSMLTRLSNPGPPSVARLPGLARCPRTRCSPCRHDRHPDPARELPTAAALRRGLCSATMPARMRAPRVELRWISRTWE